MEEITATVKQNADNAEQAHQLAKSCPILPITAAKWSAM
jgi:hypothetical protein